jgi:hypothetical protein
MNNHYFDPQNWEHQGLIVMLVIAFAVCVWGAWSNVE